MRILLLDDDIHFGRSMRRMFERRGHVVELLSSVAAAIATVTERPPDVAVIDVGLENGDGGLDFLEWLTARHPTVRRVLCTANGPPAGFVEAPPLQRYQVKPPESPDEFARVVEEGTVPPGIEREPR